jgi:hypothetical protein
VYRRHRFVVTLFSVPHACLVPILPTDPQPPTIEAVFFSSVDDQCLRHVLLVGVAGTARRSSESLIGSSPPVAARDETAAVGRRPVAERERVEMQERC